MTICLNRPFREDKKGHVTDLIGQIYFNVLLDCLQVNRVLAGNQTPDLQMMGGITNWWVRILHFSKAKFFGEILRNSEIFLPTKWTEVRRRRRHRFRWRSRKNFGERIRRENVSVSALVQKRFVYGVLRQDIDFALLKKALLQCGATSDVFCRSYIDFTEISIHRKWFWCTFPKNLTCKFP